MVLIADNLLFLENHSKGSIFHLLRVLYFYKKKFGRNGKTVYLCTRSPNAEIAQLVEHNLAKVRVASSSLVFRSPFPFLGCSNGGMVDTKDLKSFGHCGCAGSSPASSTRLSSVNH